MVTATLIQYYKSDRWQTSSLFFFLTVNLFPSSIGDILYQLERCHVFRGYRNETLDYYGLICGSGDMNLF